MSGVIVHEWLAPRGGSENVVEAMLECFPDADLWTLWNDAPTRFARPNLHESWLARTPLRRSKAAALPFMPATWARARFSGADFALLSSHAFAHHADWHNRSNVPRFVYVYTPARYVWVPEMDNRGRGPAARAASVFLRGLDRRVASAQDASFVAISNFVRSRIQDTWGVEASVIYPPVDVSRIQKEEDWARHLSDHERHLLDSLPAVFILGASRFVEYKRLDLVVRAGEAAQIPVVLAGGGPQRAELEAIAVRSAVHVTFVDDPSDALLYALYQKASVFGFFAVEDFGIMPVEAMAVGTPVVALNVGGAKESVLSSGGGAVVESTSPGALREGVERALSMDMSTARSRVGELFGSERFATELRTWITPPKSPKREA
ncbi:glycosyltransferase [Gryllotalpicola reticulitermitis]|uniref:D-inositol 3-phosphate glycosyltransferase n=1 Tax=Gryllotalpicola reticulitermitis TaxID=1184153 RepID=A0ABV8Q7L1_9MICO